jgi:hypothetical protein
MPRDIREFTDDPAASLPIAPPRTERHSAKPSMDEGDTFDICQNWRSGVQAALSR